MSKLKPCPGCERNNTFERNCAFDVCPICGNLEKVSSSSGCDAQIATLTRQRDALLAACQTALDLFGDDLIESAKLSPRQSLELGVVLELTAAIAIVPAAREPKPRSCEVVDAQAARLVVLAARKLAPCPAGEPKGGTT